MGSSHALRRRAYKLHGERGRVKGRAIKPLADFLSLERANNRHNSLVEPKRGTSFLVR